MDKIAQFFINLFDSAGGLLDWVIELINGVLGGALGLLSDWLSSIGLNFTIPTNVFNVINDIAYGVGYIFPIAALLPIPMLMLSFYIAKLVFAIYKVIASTVIKRIKIKV